MAKKMPAGVDELIKKGLITTGDDPGLVIQWRSTGVSRLDEAIGGGLPVDKFVLITGHESAGKTLLSQVIAKAIQEQGGLVALVDTEVSYDPRWWQAIGVDTEQLLVSQPPGGEAAVNVVTALIGQAQLVVVDSMAALVPLVVTERSAEEDNIAPIARIHQKFFYNVIPRLAKSGTTIIGINQHRGVVGGARPGMTTYPGGYAQRFYAHVRIEMHRAGWRLGSGGARVGVNYSVVCEKNKTAPMGGRAELPFDFDGQFDLAALIVSDACGREPEPVIVGRGAYWRFPQELADDEVAERYELKHVADTGEWQVMGRDALNRFFAENEPALRELERLTYGQAAS